jgi:hypothetical protein
LAAAVFILFTNSDLQKSQKVGYYQIRAKNEQFSNLVVETEFSIVTLRALIVTITTPDFADHDDYAARLRSRRHDRVAVPVIVIAPIAPITPLVVVPVVVPVFVPVVMIASITSITPLAVP